MAIHLIKLCVGADSIADLEAWQQRLLKTLPNPVHHTRMTPKRGDELLAGGSIYWVIKKVIRVRQRIVDIRTVPDETGRNMCELVFDPELIPVVPRRKKPFQGWRYLKSGDAPPDLTPGAKASDVPVALDVALKEAMVW
ncbi:MAG: DUF1489 domain-containing protein [Hyphomonadaceae bacterium]|nr:DUF1489 domain-containing protein [Hyphomonadaceae bacterium]